MQRLTITAPVALLCAFFGALLITLPLCASGPDFRRGDFNADGTVNLADPIGGLGFLFNGGPASSCADAADANDDGVINLADPVSLLGHLFSGTGPLPLPFQHCGFDPTDDPLGCDSFEPCGGPVAPAFVPEPPINGRIGVDTSDNPTGGVLLHSGEFTLSRVDMAIAGRGLGFVFARTYRSGDPNTPALPHAIGRGWYSNVDRRLQTVPDGRGGLIRRRHLGNGLFDDYLPDGSGGYISPDGVYSRLMQTPTGHLERSPDGTIHKYANTGFLQTVEDRLGNIQSYIYEGAPDPFRLERVIDDFGREINFLYNAAGMLETIRDFTGREVVFSYDGDNHLIEARSPIIAGTVISNDFPLGIREQYLYGDGPSLPHHLTAVIFPNEVEDVSFVPAILNSYGTDASDPTAYGRIISQQVGGTNASGIPTGGTLSFGYNFAPTGVSPGTVSQTTVTDRNGTVSHYDYNATGHMLRRVEEDPLVAEPYKTTLTFNNDGEVTSIKQPLANETQYAYDEGNPSRFGQGNLLTATQIADAARGGDGAGSAINDIITSLTYEPLFNQPLTSTEPRGNDDEYVPQNGGAQSAARYTTTFTYDWQEGATAPAEATEWGIAIDAALLNLGDRNDDGRTDQQMGLLIRSEAPTVNLLPGSNQALTEGDTAQERITRIVNNDFGQPTRITDPVASVVESSYFPENDPDGDGLDIIAGKDPVTGGYPAGSVADPAGLAISSSVTRNRRGEVLTSTDPKGNVYRITYNALDWLIRSEDPTVDPSQIHGYLSELRYDANGDVIEEAIENWTMIGGVPALVAPPLDWFRHTNVRDILGNIRVQRVDARRDSAIPASSEAEFLETQITLDNNENPTEVKSPMAMLAAPGDADEFNIVGNSFDVRDLLISQTRGLGSASPSTWSFRRDRNGNRTSFTDAVDNDGIDGPDESTTTLDGFDRVVKITDRAGNETLLTRDPASLVVREEQHGPVDGSGGQNELLAGSDQLFDEAGRLFQLDADLFIPGLPPGLPPGIPFPGVILEDGPLTPGDGKITTRFDRDAAGFSTFRLEDDGHFYQTIRDAVHRAITRTLPLIDGTGSTGPPERTRTEICFDDNGNSLKVTQFHTSPEGIAPIGTMVHRIQVDALNRGISTRDPEGNTTYVDRDSRDNVIANYDAVAGSVDMLPYEDPCLGTTVNLIANVRGNGAFTFFDGANRPWMTRREMHFGGLGDLGLDTLNPDIPDGLVDTMTVWDANSRVSCRIDDMGNITDFSHDRFNRRTGRTHADGGLHSWSFDLDHQLTGLTDENGSEHAFEVDAIGRTLSHTITAVSTTIGGTAFPMLVGSTEQTWQYNGRSQITLCTDNNDPADLDDDSIVLSIPDSLGRWVHEAQTLNAPSPFQGPIAVFPINVNCGYVSDDLVQITYPNGRQVSIAHDDHDQFKSVSDEGLCFTESLMGNCCCDAAETNWKVADPVTGDFVVIMTEVQALDGNQLPISATLSGIDIEGGFSIEDRRGDLNVTAFTQDYGFDSSGDPIERAINLILDSLDRQQAASVEQQLAFTETEMQIDGAQAIKFTGTFEDSPGAPPVFTDRDLPRDEVHQIDLPDYQHDGSPGNGNRTADANHYYQWDGFNRLRTVIDRATGNIIASYRYDAHPAIFGGRRIEKIITNSPVAGLDGITRFYYNRAHVIEEHKVEGVDEQVTRQFIHGNQTDEWVAMDVDTDDDGILDHLYFYVRDFNENVTHLIDAETETVEEIYFYDTLAAPRIIDPATLAERETSSVGNPYMLTGRRFEPETGLYYYRARYLDPVDGEFLSRDPIGMWGDGANLGNGLAYVGNNPWNGRDPSGLVDIAILLGDGTTKEPKRRSPEMTADIFTKVASAAYELLIPYPENCTDAQWENWAAARDKKIDELKQVFLRGGTPTLRGTGTGASSVTFYGLASQYRGAIEANSMIIYTGHAGGNRGTELVGHPKQDGSTGGTMDIRDIPIAKLRGKNIVFFKCYSRRLAQYLTDQEGCNAWGSSRVDGYIKIDKGAVASAVQLLLKGGSMSSAVQAAENKSKETSMFSNRGSDQFRLDSLVNPAEKK